MTARIHYADFGNTLPAVQEAGHEPLSLSTRRITPMARPADGRRLNRPLAAFWVTYLAVYVAAVAWSLS